MEHPMIYSLIFGAIFLTWTLLRILGGQRESQMHAIRIRVEAQPPASATKPVHPASK